MLYIIVASIHIQVRLNTRGLEIYITDGYIMTNDKLLSH